MEIFKEHKGAMKTVEYATKEVRRISYHVNLSLKRIVQVSQIEEKSE